MVSALVTTTPLTTLFLASALTSLYVVAALGCGYLVLMTAWAIYWMFHGYFQRKHDASLLSLAQKVTQQRQEITRLRSEFALSVEALGLANSRIETMRLELIQLEHNVNQLDAAQFELEAWRGELEPPASSAATAGVTADEGLSVFPARTESNFSQHETLGTVLLEAPDEADDLTEIWGIGAVNQQRLNEHGVYLFSQIAGWQPEQIEAFNEILGFRGRIEREGWVEQAATRIGQDAASNRAA